MKELRYILLADGSSDQALIPILEWLLQQHGVEPRKDREYVDLGRFRLPPNPKLVDKIRVIVDYYDDFDLLFIHRDAEKEPREKRVQEIKNAIANVKNPPLYVCVIPVRMQEAWLLFDEAAIRSAAGNPVGREPIKLPPLKTIEHEPNPKEILHEALCKASGRTGRRLKEFRFGPATKRLTELITDFSPLRILSAFEMLEQEITVAIRHLETRSIIP
jgi:hypothetical protein